MLLSSSCTLWAFSGPSLTNYWKNNGSLTCDFVCISTSRGPAVFGQDLGVESYDIVLSPRGRWKLEESCPWLLCGSCALLRSRPLEAEDKQEAASVLHLYNRNEGCSPANMLSRYAFPESSGVQLCILIYPGSVIYSDV